MTILVSYDIQNDRLRKKVADWLIYKGYTRVQKSVFILSTNKSYVINIKEKLRTKWSQKISKTDKIICVNISNNSLKHANFIGGYDDEALEFIFNPPKVIIY